MQTVEIIGMIYKSPKYLDFMINKVISNSWSDNYNVSLRIIANDPSQNLSDYIKSHQIPYIDTYIDPHPNEYYLNRVYRAWNYGGNTSKADIIVFINSDMAFSQGWLDNLLKHLDDKTIPCSRLVESGKMPSGQHAISKNFGRHPDQYDDAGFNSFAKKISEDSVVKLGGLYMPCAFYTKDFKKSLGYPEGNLYNEGVGKSNSKFFMSGDDYFFHENKTMKTKNHITVFDSIVYHMQEGEMDEPSSL